MPPPPPNPQPATVQEMDEEEIEKIKKERKYGRKYRSESTPIKEGHTKGKIARIEEVLAKENLEEELSKVGDLLKEKRKLEEKIGALNAVKSVVNGAPPNERSKVITPEQYLALETAGITSNKDDILFKPNPGPQTFFLASTEDEVLYGGARGGGKSYGLLVDPLRFCDKKRARALIIRKTMPELRDLIYLSRTLYDKAYPKARFRDQEKEWIFPSGARIEFGYCETDADLMRYQGQAYTWIGIDEVGQFATPTIWHELKGSLRSVDPEIPTYMRATVNPGGPGHKWLKEMFIDPVPPGAVNKVEVQTPIGVRYITRKFIPARLVDNPYLLHNDAYLISLSNLPETKRRQWLDGDWDVTENAAFPEFKRSVHVCPPFTIPKVWPRFRACDWGYVQPACVLWFAVDFDYNLYVYRELYVKGLNAEVFARRVLELEKDDPKPMSGIMDVSAWARRGELGPAIPEIMAKVGCKWRPSDRSVRNSRQSGKLEVHRRLAIGDLGTPRLKIFSTCTNLIATLPALPIDMNNPEDVDTNAEDHAYDALRYGVMSRPLTPQHLIRQMDEPQTNDYVADKTFGY